MTPEQVLAELRNMLDECHLNEQVAEQFGVAVPEPSRRLRERLEEMIPDIEAYFAFLKSLDTDEDGRISDEDLSLLDSFELFSSRHQNEDVPSE